MQIIKKPLIVRIISVIIVALFLCQNIAFCASEKISTLRPLSLFDESNENNTDDLPDSTETQPVYFFGVDLRGNNLTEGNSGMNDLLGGKGANLAQMCRITYKFDGKEYFIKVPSGFTITTEESKLYFDNGNQLRKELIEAIDNNLAKLENATGRKFGDKDKPLIVSIRSGAPASMPGMLATVLNIGLNDETVEALAKELDNPRSAWDSYRRLIMMFGDSALGLGPFKFNEIWESKIVETSVGIYTELTVEDLKDVVNKFKKYILKETGQEFPQDLRTQLYTTIEAIFESTNNERAIRYRKAMGLPDDMLSAVNIQTMVFGNLNEGSGAGVGFTRNPSNGENELYGEILFNAQGEDVVAGSVPARPIDELEEKMPDVYRELEAQGKALEKYYKRMLEIEFTIQNNVLWLLQVRRAMRATDREIALKILNDLHKEGIITVEEIKELFKPFMKLAAPLKFNEEDLEKAESEGRLIFNGRSIAISTVGVGEVVFNSDDAVEVRGKGKNVILVRKKTAPDDIHGMTASDAILAHTAGKTSHVAVVSRTLGKPVVVGKEIRIDEERKQFKVVDTDIVVRKGTIISVDGYTGNVYLGEIKTVKVDTGIRDTRDTDKSL